MAALVGAERQQRKEMARVSRDDINWTDAQHQQTAQHNVSYNKLNAYRHTSVQTPGANKQLNTTPAGSTND